MNWNKKNYKFVCNNLNHEIVPEGSYTKQTSSGLIVYMKKAKDSDYWDNLEKKKSTLGRDDEKPNKSKDPNESLMDMMRDMYQSGDPEMKRIIAESWTKSRSGEAPKGFDL
jgi:calcyclin binding protein